MREHILYDEALVARAADLGQRGELSREPLGDTVRFALTLTDGTRLVGTVSGDSIQGTFNLTLPSGG